MKTTRDELQGGGVKLHDDQWRMLEPFLIGKANDPGTPGKDNRLFIDAMLWIVSANLSWHYMPPQFGKWNAVYMRFRRWTEANIWHQLLQNKFDDRGLLLMLEQIAEYGDAYTNRLRQRRQRRSSRENYRKANTASAGNVLD